jgi:hypothetical protein
VEELKGAILYNALPRVLTFDGEGIRGLSALTILGEILKNQGIAFNGIPSSPTFATLRIGFLHFFGLDDITRSIGKRYSDTALSSGGIDKIEPLDDVRIDVNTAGLEHFKDAWEGDVFNLRFDLIRGRAIGINGDIVVQQ